MLAFWIIILLIALIAIAVTTYNIVDGVKKAKDEMKRIEYESKS